jgi:hypothetical protein
MGATVLAAWVGAVTGAGGILWDVYKWKASARPKLRVSVTPGMKVHPRQRGDPTYVSVQVSNVGTSPTTIQNFGFSRYGSWSNRIRRRREGPCSVVLIPLTSQPLPYKIDVGTNWTGMALQNQDLEELMQTGNLWCEVFHSFSGRSALAKIPTQ